MTKYTKQCGVQIAKPFINCRRAPSGFCMKHLGQRIELMITRNFWHWNDKPDAKRVYGVGHWKH